MSRSREVPTTAARGASAHPPVPRAVALEVLLEVERGRRLDVAWEARAPALPLQDRGWVQELVYGVVRFRGRLDHLLGLHLHRGTGSLHPRILILLRMGAWQLLSMGSVPSYAAVSETVEQARLTPKNAGGGKGAAGLVNAVLRRLAEAGGGPERFPSLEEDPVAHLASWGSHPAWLVERWIARYGRDGAVALVEAGNRIPRTHLRRLDTGEGVELEPGSDVVEALGRLHPAQVQDPAASAVVDFMARGMLAAGLAPGARVADLCAAPGGKGLALAGLSPLRARVVALDPSRARLGRVAENLRRLGWAPAPDPGAQGDPAGGRVDLVVARGEVPPLPPGSMDGVLVDAPCTGTGTLARHPDARWRLDPGAPARLARVQAAILEGAAGIVRTGGILVYSTCTLEPEENEARVEGFIQRHPAFRLEEDLRVLPRHSGTDGSFAARFRKENDGT
jgi:16S rRNA (cytosine967-C5)-methyltransferase